MTARNPYSTKILEALVSQSRSALKLDVSYLAGAAVIFTAFGMSGEDLATSKLGWIGFQYLGLLAFDTTVYCFMFHDWISSQRYGATRAYSVLLSIASKAQPIAHLFFITGIISYGLGYADGLADFGR